MLLWPDPRLTSLHLMKAMTKEDFRGLTPLIFNHINPLWNFSAGYG